MDNIREIVCENLIALRKAKGMTQVELSKYVNYSDKAISRWEKGEVLPDYEVLHLLSGLYNVDMGYFFVRHIKEENEDNTVKNQVLLTLFIGFSIYTFLTILFVYFMIYKNISLWQLFVYGVPLTALGTIITNNQMLRLKTINFICCSVIVWSTLASIYVQFLKYNIWLVYIIGVPIQACLVFIFIFMKGNKNSNNKNNRKKE